MSLFKRKPKESNTHEDDLRAEILRRAAIYGEAKKLALEMHKKTYGKPTKKFVANANALKIIEKVLDKVSKYDNIKIAAITELYLALESGDTKNLIEFLKSEDSGNTP